MTAMFPPPHLVATAIGWRQVFGFGPHNSGDARFRERVRGAQLALLNRYAPFNFALLTVNLGALAWLLRDSVDPDFVAGWAAVMAGLASLWVMRWIRSRRAPIDVASPGEFWSISAEVASFGIVWGALMLRMLPLVDRDTQMVMLLLSATAIGACSFAAQMLPVCGSALVLSIAALTLAGLPADSPLSTPMVWLAFASFAALALRGIFVASEAMMARMRAQTDSAEASAVIGLLLGEFEAHGSDWLIEVDANGGLTHVSPRLCEVSGRSRAALLGQPLHSLLAPDQRDAAVRGARRTMFRHFERRVAFRDFIVPIAVGDELRWWSLTGTPKNDPQGGFAGFRGVGCDVTEARRATDRIAELARFDPLTGLANRALIRSSIAEALGGAARGGGECALLFIDLDRFKQVNDSLGHYFGDLLLREVAVRLREIAGASPRIGRLGGDEFAVVVPSCTARRAERLAKAVVAALSRPFLIEDRPVSIGASVGYALGPGDGDAVDTLLRAADLALYEVKGGGRGAACRFVPEIKRRAQERRELEAELAQALDRGELSLAFQPIVEAADERIVGFEALLRWTHPRLGSIPPVKFIPVAEDTGLICRIGDWVIEEACRWAARWPDDIRIAVNLSALQFDDPNLPRIIRNALIASNIAPDRLELEITESVFLNDRPATAAMIARLRALGIRFALDDFGTGYSSLSYLRKADFSRIKIDRSFVQRAATDGGESTAIIKAIVSLATSLGMATTAEGTETRAEFEACRALGCGQVQGYLFGRPMPPEDATALVALRLAA